MMTQRIKTTAAKKPKMKKFLTFSLGNERYAIDILSVQEIKSYSSVNKMLQMIDAPKFVKGVMYDYNAVLPIVDMNELYQLGPVADEKYLIIIVLKLVKSYIGITVDYDLDIVEIYEDSITISPESFSFVHHQFILGVASKNDKLIIILDAEKLIHIVDVINVNSAV